MYGEKNFHWYQTGFHPRGRSRSKGSSLTSEKDLHIVHGNVFEANPRSICSFGREVHQSTRDPLPIVTGWGGCEFVPEEEMEGQLAREIISFANNGEAAGVVGDYEMPGLPRTSGGTPTLASMRQFMSISNPTNPLHLLVTIHIHRRERARTKAEGKGKYTKADLMESLATGRVGLWKAWRRLQRLD